MNLFRTMVGRLFPAEAGAFLEAGSRKAGSRKTAAGKGAQGRARGEKAGAGKAGKGSSMDRIPDALRSQAEDWAELWGLPGLPDSVTLEFSRRLRSSLGLCRPTQSLIRLAAHLEEGNEDLLEEVLCHELAHVAVYRLYGRSVRPHGREWKGLISAAGFEPRVRFQPGEGRFPPRAVGRKKGSR